MIRTIERAIKACKLLKIPFATAIDLFCRTRRDGVGAQILTAPKVRSMRILTNHPCKLAALEAYGLKMWPKRR